MARALQLDLDVQYAIYYAALLHDYGKIGTDDSVLKKPSSLTPDEYKHIQQHPQHTFDILSKIEFPPVLRDLPLMAASHHEKWDGTGYPWGLRGEDIPLAGRIIAIADVYDSLTRKRHYREPMPVEEVLAYIEQGRGTHFDPAVLDAFLLYHKDELVQRLQRRESKRARHKTADETTQHGAPVAPAPKPPADLNAATPPGGSAVASADSGPSTLEPTVDEPMHTMDPVDAVLAAPADGAARVTRSPLRLEKRADRA
jgi:HD-GYP domain-containing protein (c-di-GMP phosphodiesterase class II)